MGGELGLLLRAAVALGCIAAPGALEVVLQLHYEGRSGLVVKALVLRKAQLGVQVQLDGGGLGVHPGGLSHRAVFGGGMGRAGAGGVRHPDLLGERPLGPLLGHGAGLGLRRRLAGVREAGGIQSGLHLGVTGAIEK